MKQFLETGKIVGTHGIRGEMRVDPWCDSPEFLAGIKKLYLDEGKNEIEIISSRVHKRQVLLRMVGIDTVEQADLLRGKVLYLNRDDIILDDGQVFIDDLIGLTVKDGDTGIVYGTLTKVLETGANDVYCIQGEKGEEFLFPAVKHMIKKIDLENGVVEVLPIPGIFDNGGFSDAN